MTTPRVRSVNIGRPRDVEWAGLGYTSIDKAALTDPVRVHRLGLVGDVVSDTKHHGGPDQAVYAFAREDLDLWAERLGQPIRDGQFGENLTTEGIDVNEAVIGTRWRIGTVLLEVAFVRTPCNDFKNWMGVSGYDDSHWVKKFTTECRPGPYLRVLEEGTLAAGDEIHVESVPEHGLSVSTMFRAVNLDHSLLPQFLVIDDLVDQVRDKATRIAEGLSPERTSI
jgi:MOSC domain-containing protein YiiM